MKKISTILMLSLCLCGTYAQDKNQDSTKVEKLEEVLVRAIRVNANSPISHSNISKKELEKRNLGQDIPILLNFLPSVVTTSDAGAGIGYTGIRVRGVSAQSTNITINGIPYNDAESLGTFWVDLPDFSSSIENLQLQRGVGSSTNGSGAFGASINVLTDAISEKAQGEISNSFGSYNSFKHNLKFSTGLLNDRIEIAGRLSKISSDGYIDRASSDLKSYFLQASYTDENTLVKGLVFGGHEITYQAWNGIDLETLQNNRTFNPSGIYTDENGQTQFYENEVDNYKQDHYQLHWNERFNRSFSMNIGLNYTHGKGYFEQFREDEELEPYNLAGLNLGGTGISQSDLIRRRWLDNDFYVLNLSANYIKGNINLNFGSSFSTYKGDHFGEVIWAQAAGNSQINDRYYDGNGKKNDLNLFSKATYRMTSKLSLYGDLQFRSVVYNTFGTNSDDALFEIDKTHQFVNPKAGLSYEHSPGNSFYLSYARANREPSRTDYENNSEVKAEKLNDLELGYRFKGHKSRLNANLYYMFYEEQLVLTGAIDDVGNPIRDNSGKSYRLGLEIEAALSLGEKWSLHPNLTLSSNKRKETFIPRDGELADLGKTRLSYSPEIIAANSLVFMPFTGFQATLLSKYVGEQFMGNTDSEVSKLNSYFVNDLNLIYVIKPQRIFKEIVLSGLVNNIFNKKYVSNGYYFTYEDDFSVPGTISTVEGAGYYPQATRNFLMGLTLKF